MEESTELKHWRPTKADTSGKGAPLRWVSGSLGIDAAFIGQRRSNDRIALESERILYSRSVVHKPVAPGPTF